MSCFSCTESISDKESTILLTCGHILCHKCALDADNPPKCLECGVPLDVLQNNSSQIEKNIKMLVYLHSVGTRYLQHISEQHSQLIIVRPAPTTWLQEDVDQWKAFHNALVKSWATDNDTLSEILIALQSVITNYRAALGIDSLRSKFTENFDKIHEHWNNSLTTYAPKFDVNQLDAIWLYHLPIINPAFSFYVLIMCGEYHGFAANQTEHIHTFPPLVKPSINTWKDDHLVHTARKMTDNIHKKWKIDHPEAFISVSLRRSALYPAIFLFGGHQIPVIEYKE